MQKSANSGRGRPPYDRRLVSLAPGWPLGAGVSGSSPSVPDQRGSLRLHSLCRLWLMLAACFPSGTLGFGGQAEVTSPPKNTVGACGVSKGLPCWGSWYHNSAARE